MNKMIESYSRENIYNDNNTDNVPAGIHCLLLQFHLTQQTFVLMKTSFVFVFRRRLQDILIKTNIFAILIRLQKTSWRRLDQDQYIRFRHTSSRCLQDVFKTSSRRFVKISSRCFQDVSSSYTALVNKFLRCLQGVFPTFLRCSA